MTIKHSIYMPTVPFLCTERACVVFLRYQNSPGKIFSVKSSVASIKDQREYNFDITIHMSTRPEGFLDLDKILLYPYKL